MSNVSRVFVFSLFPLMCTLAPPRADATAPADARQSAVAAGYGRLPLAFEANSGQISEPVKFAARGAGYALYLTPAGTQLQLLSGDSKQMAILGTRLAGSSADARFTGEELLPGRSSYLSGSDQKRWRSDVPQYARVRSTGAYPGIDLVYYGNAGQLEYDFVVAPGADPARIRMQYEGARKLELNRDGDLVIRTAAGELVQQQPVAYQDIAGRRNAVPAKYRLKNSTLTIALGAYDRSRELVIDPLLAYRVYVPLVQHEYPNSIAIDGAGNAYIAGVSLPFDYVTIVPLASQLLGNYDAFIAKLNPAGTALSYVMYFGGAGADTATSLAVDASGNAYVAGYTASNDFPVLNAAQASKVALADGFITKINAAGNALVYSTYLGGVGYDYVYGLALAATGAVVVTGVTDSPDFPVTTGAYQQARSGHNDGFVARLNPDGGLAWSSYLGGSDADLPVAVAMDINNDVYVAGATYSLNFPTSPGAVQPVHSPPFVYSCGSNTCSTLFQDAFVSKLSANGSSLLYSTFVGGIRSDYAKAVTVDGAGNAYFAGYTESNDFPATGSLTGGGSAFVAKLNANASALPYATRFGGSNSSTAEAIALDGGSAVVAGETYSSDFQTKTPMQRANSGSGDIFISKFTPAGTALVFSTYLGQYAGDFARAITLDAAGNIFLAAQTLSRNFPVTPSPNQAFGTGRSDPIVAKIKADGSGFVYSTYLGATNIYAKLAFVGNGNAAQSGQAISLPLPLIGDVGCLLRAVDGGIIAGTSILFPNQSPCGQMAPPP